MVARLERNHSRPIRRLLNSAGKQLRLWVKRREKILFHLVADGCRKEEDHRFLWLSLLGNEGVTNREWTGTAGREGRQTAQMGDGNTQSLTVGTGQAFGLLIKLLAQE